MHNSKINRAKVMRIIDDAILAAEKGNIVNVSIMIQPSSKISLDKTTES